MADAYVWGAYGNPVWVQVSSFAPRRGKAVLSTVAVRNGLTYEPATPFILKIFFSKIFLGFFYFMF